MPFKNSKKQRYYLNLYQNRNRIKMTTFYQSFKNRPCADCLGWFEPWQMDFDHRPTETKLFCIAMKRVSKKRLLDEIKKCDVVCSNCHRDRTHKRKMNVKSRIEIPKTWFQCYPTKRTIKGTAN